MKSVSIPRRFRVLDQEGEPGKTCNGGSYDFWRTFTRAEAGNYKVRYRTSADFAYCPKQGRFQDCGRCGMYDRDRQECAAHSETVGAEEVRAIYEQALRDGALMAD
jgi:hypothetical protein